MKTMLAAPKARMTPAYIRFIRLPEMSVFSAVQRKSSAKAPGRSIETQRTQALLWATLAAGQRDVELAPVLREGEGMRLAAEGLRKGCGRFGQNSLPLLTHGLFGSMRVEG